MRTIAGNGGGKTQLPITESITACRNDAVLEGFKDIFSVTPRGLYSLNTSRYFRPEQVIVQRSIRVDGNPNGMDDAAIYFVETADGLRGTLTDALNGPGNPGILAFIAEVETIQRQLEQYGRHHC